MPQFISIGETMVSFVPTEQVSLSYGPSLKMRIAGAESNTAIALQRLGISTAFVSRLGDDTLGQYVLRMIRAEGVDTSDVCVDRENPTGLMIKEMHANRETRVYYYRNGSAAAHMTKCDIPEQKLAEADILHLTGITPVLSESCKELTYAAMEQAMKHKTGISFDPNIRRKLWKQEDYRPLMQDLIRKTTYLFLGMEEAEYIYGTSDINTLGDKLYHSGNMKCVVFKDGSRGAWCYDGDNMLQILPENAICVDPIGAGDAFNAGFLYGILHNYSYSESGKIGAICGARAIETSGDIEGLIYEEELLESRNNVSPICR